MEATLKYKIAVVLVVCILSLVICGSAGGATIPVRTDGSGYYPTIQAAIDAANDGDEVIVSDGIYKGEGNRDIDFKGKAVTVRSTEPNDPNIVEATVIDCNGSELEPHRGFIFASSEDIKSVVKGLTIKNGRSWLGGGIYCEGSSPTISKCIIENNAAYHHGGGLYLKNSNPVIHECIVRGNKTLHGHGGAIFCVRSMPHILNSTIKANSAESSGAGIFSNKSIPRLFNCNISDNTAAELGNGIFSINDSKSVVSPDTRSPTALLSGNTYYVNGSCGDDSWSGLSDVCTGPDGPKLTVQAAIDSSVDGDCIIVFAGIYFENLEVNDLDITLSSLNPDEPASADETVIDGGGAGRVLMIADSNVTISGLTLQNGDEVSFSDVYGAGIYCKGGSPLINNCRVEGNILGDGSGAGIYIESDSGSIINCIVSYNSGIGDCDGGGIYCTPGSIVINNCTVSGNHAGWGGGVKTGQGATVTNCTITSNWIWDWGGSGIECYNSHISDCIIADNYGDFYGGAIFGFTDVSTISNCIIRNNKHSGWGGGLWNCDGPITNCIIENNKSYPNFGAPDEGGRGAGLYDCDGAITNCTIVGNELLPRNYPEESHGGGLYDCNGIISNCIIWGNVASMESQVCGCAEPRYSCIQDCSNGGVGNIASDPCFSSGGYWDVNGTPADTNDDFWVNGDYHLKSAYGRWDGVKQRWVYDDVNSLCVDSGDPNSDWTSELWPHGKRINMGAYGGTSQASMSASTLGNIADLNNDGIVDMIDYCLFSGQWYLGQARTIPKGTIVVDANLDDWTGHVEWIPLDKVYYGEPCDVAEAKFALRWSESSGKIYSAVIVDENDHIFTNDYGSWDASDRVEVYSQGDAAGGTGWWHSESPTWDAAQQYMVAPDTVGGSWATWGNGWAIDPCVGLEYAVRVDSNNIIYEVGVPQFDNYGGFSGGQTVPTFLKAGHVVGFDIVADTRYSGGFGMLSENLMVEKFKDADSFAQYILAANIAEPPYGPMVGDVDRNQVVDWRDLKVLCYNWLDQE